MWIPLNSVDKYRSIEKRTFKRKLVGFSSHYDSPGTFISLIWIFIKEKKDQMRLRSPNWKVNVKAITQALREKDYSANSRKNKVRRAILVRDDRTSMFAFWLIKQQCFYQSIIHHAGWFNWINHTDILRLAKSLNQSE